MADNAEETVASTLQTVRFFESNAWMGFDDETLQNAVTLTGSPS